MFGDLTEQPQHDSQNALLSFKRIFKKQNVPLNDLELQRRKPLACTSQSQQEQAVCVRDAYKYYGNTYFNPVVVLDGLNMTVPKGTIYGLLGASGCGKTTLLNCILGRKMLNSGKMWVLGGIPGSKGSGVPGPRVGFMPQETALYDDFTIRETLLYYGWVAGMTNRKIRERLAFLKNLLMLPDTDQLVKTLSGGQQRRVSLASALLHEPELLILDEPTVGVDPLLRETIWKHLIDIAIGGNVTIILTTHYIEEARQAHVVGLLRGGYFLAEEPPENIIMRYGCKTLEDTFLKLSVRQNQLRCRLFAEEVVGDTSAPINECVVPNYKISEKMQAMPSSHKGPSSLPSYEDADIIHLPEMPLQNHYASQISDYFPTIKVNHMKALVWKGFVWMMRNIPAMLCVIMLPVTQIPVFCLAVGHDPRDLSIAVVNYETNNTVNCNDVLSCYSTQLSCSYLGYLTRRADLNLIYFDSEEHARESVLSGETYASIVVKHNYSAALRVRVNDFAGAETWDIVASQIDVFRDVSNKHIATSLKVYLYDTFQEFIMDFAESCDVDRKLLKVPIKWGQPIYGVKYPNFTDFAMPGVLVMITFFLAVAATSFGMLIERNEGSFERTFVIGITEIELLIAHIVCQFVIMVSQAVMALVCAFAIFNMTQRGSLVLIAAHTVLTGFSGMCYGLLVSCICDRESTAMYLALGSVLPMLFLCGVIWPVEALHPLLQPVAYLLPLTQATESLRSILQRGWGFSTEIVYMGFVSLGAWTVIFLAISILFLKLRKSEIVNHIISFLIITFLKLKVYCNCRAKWNNCKRIIQD